MATMTGTLLDFGVDPMASRSPRLVFKPSGPGVRAQYLFASRAITVTPDQYGAFEVELEPTAYVVPKVWYRLTIEWLDSGGNFVEADDPDWVVVVPVEGGPIAENIAVVEPDRIITKGEPGLPGDASEITIAAAEAAAEALIVGADLIKRTDPGAPVQGTQGWPYRFRNDAHQVLGGFRPDSFFEALKGVAIGDSSIRRSDSLYMDSHRDSTGRISESAYLKDGTKPQWALDRWAVRMGVKTVIVHLTVRPSPGAGEFASPKLANDSITDASEKKQYIINVMPGVYTEINWTLKDYVTLRGTLRDQCILRGEMPDSATNEETVQANTVWLRGTIALENLTVSMRNGRYPVHDESNGETKDYVQRFTNCVFEHQGNQGMIDYRNANGISLVGMVDGDQAWGYGASSGGVQYFENVTFISKTKVWYMHDREDWTTSGRHHFKGCRFVAREAESVFQVETLGSGVDTTVTVTDSEVDALYVSHRDVPWISEKAENQRADHYQIRVTITGLEPIGFRTSARGRALRFTSASTGAVSTVRVGGAGASVLMGEASMVRDGGGGLQGYTYGTWDMSNIQVGINQNIVIANNLGRRLGNRTASPLTFTVTADGGAPQTVTLDADYTASSDATVLAAINGQLAGVTASTYLVTQGERYPDYPDRQRTLTNTGAAGIPRFAAVKQGTSGRGIALMTTTDPVEAFLGVSVQAIPPGKTGRILTSGLLDTIASGLGTSQAYGVNTALAVGAPLYLSNVVDGQFATAGDRQIGVGYSTGWAKF